MILVRVPELDAVEKAEDLFEVLEVPYDRRFVAVHRTRLLRLFGQALAALQDSVPFLSEAAIRATLRAALRDAYERVGEDASCGAPAPRPGKLVQLVRRVPG